MKKTEEQRKQELEDMFRLHRIVELQTRWLQNNPGRTTSWNYIDSICCSAVVTIRIGNA